MIKKFVFICSLFLLLSINHKNVYGAVTLDIRDPQLLEGLLKYDSNSNGLIENIELKGDIVLDGYNIKSLKGLENEWFDNLYIRSSGLTSLPDGIADMNCTNIYLNDNNLTDVDEIIDLLETKIYKSTTLIIDGNPCYEQVIDYWFNDFNYHLSIIGNVGTSYWQKEYGRHNLKIDDMNDNDVFDYCQGYFFLDTSKSGLGQWNYEIEDTSIAVIDGELELGRYYMANDIHSSMSVYSHNMYRSDRVIKVNLLKEGYTRMKITCGDYVKYTDIWVLPQGQSGTGVFALPYISDIEIGNYLNNNYRKEYSGMHRCKSFRNLSKMEIDGKESYIKDFSTFEFAGNLKGLTFVNYSNDMINNISNLKMVPILNSVLLTASIDQKVNVSEYLSSADDLGRSLDWNYSLCDQMDGNIAIINNNLIDNIKDIKINKISGYGDVNYDSVVNSCDALDVLKKSAKLTEMSNIQEHLSDINNNQSTESEDALIILKYAARIIKELPYTIN